jgi:hypothetical protein
MKTTFTKALIAIAVSAVAFATSANAQSTATASTTATLITPISITKTADLNFGSIASSSLAGTVVLGYNNVPTLNGGVTSPNDGASATTASFTVSGEATSGFSIAMPATVTLSNGTQTLVVSEITADAGTSSTLEGGSKTINVGATLTVPANTVAGTYVNNGAENSGLYVTVNYN